MPEPYFDRERWTPLERESLDFRYLQDPGYNLTESELQLLARLRDQGLRFGLLPRVDPTSFVRIQLGVGLQTQRVEVSVDISGRYASFLTRQTPLTEQITSRLTEILGERLVDRERSITTKGHVWLSFYLEPGQKGQSSLFNFDPSEQRFLELLEGRARQQPGLEFHVYPRGTTYGGIELTVSDGRASQAARIFVRGEGPIVYQAVTENTPLGRRLADYLQLTLGEGQFDADSSRTTGRFLSLVYTVGG